MTRLVADDIDGLGASLPEYDAYLRRLTGAGLAAIAAHAQMEGHAACEYEYSMRKIVVGVVPMEYGEGVIPGFAEAVRDIAAFLGAEAFVTGQANIRGMAEAVAGGATMLLLSDDDDFMALHLKENRISHNSEATGRGFAAALDLMAGGVRGREVLVVGAGPVGRAAVRCLQKLGGLVCIHDQSVEAARRLAETTAGVRIAANLATAMAHCDLVIEATPAAGVIRQAWLRPEHRIAAPGVPLGIETGDGEALTTLAYRYILHDRLELGVATMLFSAVTV